MRFSLFTHMERIDSEQSHQQLYDEFVEICTLADRSGFCTIWTGEHHGMDFTIAPNPLTNLVDLSHRTKNVRLGTATICAPMWHPIKLAGEVAMADIITNGRLEIGMARGAYSFEYERFDKNLNAWTAGQKLREMIPAIKQLWKGDYVHDGEHWSFPKTSSAPKPIQTPHPPIWVAARDANSHEFAVENGCNVQVTPLWLGDDEVVSLMEKFKNACALHPTIPRPEIMVLRHTFVGETEEEIEQGAKDLSRFYCYFGAWFKNERPISQGLIEPLTETEMAAIDMYSPDKMRVNHVVGTPAEVIERLKGYEAMGYDEYSFWLDSSMSYEKKRRSLELFIEHVMPAFNN
ncbi:MAG: alkanesulfonate monooxygenase SsuD [Cellvibrionaceae bacterium]|jgi:alkanesulfonate monooxygenase SsuD/methylene tetrahydromethanopterin reductase-like flavin-dependent oxidoreductase (luciferase family)